jgi:hypothetical protein
MEPLVAVFGAFTSLWYSLCAGLLLLHDTLVHTFFVVVGRYACSDFGQVVLPGTL